MMREFWNRIMRRSPTTVRETERERMSSAERRFSAESVEDHQADEFVAEHLGGAEPDRLGDEPPHT